MGFVSFVADENYMTDENMNVRKWRDSVTMTVQKEQFHLMNSQDVARLIKSSQGLMHHTGARYYVD